MKRKVVVLGGSGFIGRNIAEMLAKRSSEFEVIATHFSRPSFSHPAIHFRMLDLRTLEGARAALAGADIVVQAAATTSGAKDIVERPYIHVTDNAVMNAYLLQAAYEQKIKQFIFFSCSVMYPNSPEPQSEIDFPDATQIQPKYFGVAQTKLYIESLLRFYAKLLPESDFIALRHSNIYGPYDKFDLQKSHVCGASITKVMQADKMITIWGSGEEPRDLLYVKDLCRLVERIIEQPQRGFQLLNAGSGNGISINELISKIIELSGKSLSMEHDLSQPTIPTQIILSGQRALQVYGWKPEHSLHEGLALTLNWYREQKFP